jgi:hypothetical protein
MWLRHDRHAAGPIVPLPRRAHAVETAEIGVFGMHDIVIRGGTILDGTGAPSFAGDIAIEGDRIAAVGGKAGPAKRVVAKPTGCWSPRAGSMSTPITTARRPGIQY